MKPTTRTSAFLIAALIVFGNASANEAAKPASANASGVVVKVEKAIERGAHAAASGVERGVKAAASGVERGAKAVARGVEHGMKAMASGIERGAKATDRAAHTVAKKVGISPASSASSSK